MLRQKVMKQYLQVLKENKTKQKETMYNSMTSKFFFKAEGSDIRLNINQQ